jgi:hypothetical protein
LGETVAGRAKQDESDRLSREEAKPVKILRGVRPVASEPDPNGTE